MENFLLLGIMPYRSKISIINRDPVAITSFLRKLGRTKFKERLKSSIAPYPQFSQLFFLLENDICWLLMKGEHRDHTLFSLELDEIPLYGWQVQGKKERIKKIK